MTIPEPRTPRRHIETHQARTRRPLKFYPLTGDGPGRIVPGGALVAVTENHSPVTENRPTGDTIRTATAHLDGVPYECEIRQDQYVTTNQ